MTSVDVLIVTYNSRATINACLDAIPVSAEGLRVDVAVWDNASSDGTCEWLYEARQRRPNVSVHGSVSNLGFPRGCNELLGRTAGAFVCLLNPDVELTPGVLETLVSLAKDPTVGIATCRLETPDGRAQREAARRHPTLLRVVAGLLGAGAIRSRIAPPAYLSRDQDVECGMGALLVARREVLEQVGGLDDSVFMYLEDLDLCRQVTRGGLRVRYAGSLAAAHVSSASREKTSRVLDGLGPLVWVSYFSRYGTRGERLFLRPALGLAYLCRGLVAVGTMRPGAAGISLANAARAITVRPVQRGGLGQRFDQSSGD